MALAALPQTSKTSGRNMSIWSGAEEGRNGEIPARLTQSFVQWSNPANSSMTQQDQIKIEDPMPDISLQTTPIG
ncbi:hypothetical protein RRG08_031880 [Elysia crispata]|uniref:Uncharacterized protein n=1 Tax=Elysia crispata TaxID=231223 RepID=A0AAE1DYH7_9GAST|nr:hypothetical protein RRG08_031880 [Elysia crispata]